MLTIALELAKVNRSYEDMASNFLSISSIFQKLSIILPIKLLSWNEEDGFYYDMLEMKDGNYPLKIHSLVGLIPLVRCNNAWTGNFEGMPGFNKRLEWFLHNRYDLCDQVACNEDSGISNRRILSIVNP